MDARGRHPARYLPSGLSRYDRRHALRRQGCGFQIQSHGLIRDCTLAAAGLPARNRYRCDRLCRRHALRHCASARRVCARRARGGAHRFLAWCGAEQQRLCDRVLHGRAREEGGEGPDRVPPCHAREIPPLPGGARSRGGEIELGQAPAGAHRPRRLGAARFRKLYRDGGGGGGGCTGRGALAPRDERGGHRHRGQPGHHRRATAGGPHLRAHRGAVRRGDGEEWSCTAVELQRLSHAAHRSGSSDRGLRDQER